MYYFCRRCKLIFTLDEVRSNKDKDSCVVGSKHKCSHCKCELDCIMECDLRMVVQEELPGEKNLKIGESYQVNGSIVGFDNFKEAIRFCLSIGKSPNSIVNIMFTPYFFIDIKQKHHLELANKEAAQFIDGAPPRCVTVDSEAKKWN